MASSEPETIRLLLAGKTGSGKSSTANSILGKDKFKTGFGCSSMTQISQHEEREWDQYTLQVMDSPGLFDTEKTHKEIAQQVVQALFDLRPGPHVFLYVVSIAGRYTEEEFNTYKRLKKYFGKEITKHMLVVFTHGDALEKEYMTGEEYMTSDSITKSLKKVLQECGNRYVVFNNEVDNKEPQVEQLMKVVLQLYVENENECFKDSYPLEIASALEQLHLNVKEAERKELEENETFIRVEKEKKEAELAQQREEEEREKAEARARVAQQARQKAQEETKKAEERARVEQQARQKAQEEKEKAEARARVEQQARQKAQEEKEKAEARARVEQQARQKAQEEKEKAEARARVEQQARQKAQEEKEKAEKKAEKQRREYEAQRKEAEEQRRRELEAHRKEAEEQRRKYEAERREDQRRYECHMAELTRQEHQQAMVKLAQDKATRERRPDMLQKAQELRREAASLRKKSTTQYAFAPFTLGLSTIGAGDRQEEADDLEAEANMLEKQYS